MVGINREEWLTQALAPVCAILAGVGRAVDPGEIKVSVGFPSRSALNTKKVHCAEAWNGEGSGKRGTGLGGSKSADGKTNIFVSPLIDDEGEVLGALTHALCHVAVGFEERIDKRMYAHGPLFQELCTSIGLTKGNWVDAMPENKLGAALAKVAESLGEYPHGAIAPAPKFKSARGRNRHLSYECPACEAHVTLTQKLVDGAGPPYCACLTVPGKLKRFVATTQREKERAEAEKKAKSAVLPDPATNGNPALVGAGA